MLTANDIALVRASFAKVLPIKDAAADLFYNRLFEIAPQLRAMFPKDLREQKTKLMAMIAAAVGGLNDLNTLVPHVKAGKLKAIAVTSTKRLDDAPTVPTLAEGGFGDVLGGSGWFGIVAPLGTPPAIVRRFNEEINTALQSPEVIERLRKAYAFAEGGSPEEFSKFLNDEGTRWTRLVKDANIKLD